MHCFICPTYGCYDYARAAVKSFFEHTPSGVVVIVDDAHPGFHKFWDDKWNVIAHQFKQRRGLTRSWNYGLIQARNIGAKYAICGNSDILFTPGWDLGPTALLEDDTVGLVGPLSNAPGLISPKRNVWDQKQNIWDHVTGYEPSSTPERLAGVSAHLARLYKATDHLPVRAVNGFFMIGRTASWWEGKYDKRHVFNPAPRYAMIGNEMELQRRHLARGWRSLVSLRTYIFHYRSVTRGEKFKVGMWHRNQPS
jgi:GT2 family glycosyltransferase